MELVIKAVAGVLVCVVLGLIISKQSKEYTLLLTMAMCCVIGTFVFSYLQTIVVFIQKLRLIGVFSTDILNILLKSTGIVILSEITSLICADAGNAALGKMIQLLASVVILCLALPLFEQLIELLEDILSAI